jgi:hypothetical protein
VALYRCYCRNALNQITSRHDIIAPDLEAALREAQWLCRSDSVEIWQGILRIYPPPDPDDGAARPIAL